MYELYELTLFTGIENFLRICGEIMVILCLMNSGQSCADPEKNPNMNKSSRTTIKTNNYDKLDIIFSIIARQNSRLAKAKTFK